jgi:hypothetical protein
MTTQFVRRMFHRSLLLGAGVGLLGWIMSPAFAAVGAEAG